MTGSIHRGNQFLHPYTLAFAASQSSGKTKAHSMEYSINSPEELKTRFVCAKQLIWTDEDKVDIDGCESFEFNELLIYVKEIEAQFEAINGSD